MIFKKTGFTLAASMCLLLAAIPQAQAGELIVSGAASLTNAFKELGTAFQATHPATKLQFNFAASDTLLQQIAKGAPVDVFASADQETMDKAEAQKLIAPQSRRNFVGNSLVVILPSDSTATVKALGDLKQAGFKRIAIGNPASVPVGRYTKEVLEAAGSWPALEGKMILAQNVRQSLDYVARGEVDAGFVYGTDAAIQRDKVKVALTVPTQKPISYPLAVTAASGNAAEARQFVEFALSPEAQAIFAKYGFTKP
ncbi:molybdate ABC transporter substrate-binding protein [Undibacterium sp.]|jgi:molybdate transport system substrate-binding protein|uniref:molybdate ABC transporter substrate-binding protein n=1 Tax=Undibacterium sp. TaxID=1914977 RepID=UPI002BC15DD5|nr:molybdate ABC transporter substrate-binding protein [Undibacterium sp.]HTD03664.1 molybdate ABC transporter substrate-binding protein [Undibacterium sp.]